MAVTKLSVSLDENLARDVRERARRTGQTVSALIGEIVADGLRHAALSDALAQWEAEHGVITEQMMNDVQTRHPTRYYGAEQTTAERGTYDRAG